MMKGIESTLGEYLEELRRDEPCCPLCHRGFKEVLESQELFSKVSDRQEPSVLFRAAFCHGKL